MSKKCKFMVYIIITMIVSLIVYALFYMIMHFGVIKVNLSLKGADKITLHLNEKYKEEGYTAYYRFKSYQDEVQTTTNLNTSKIGKYKITYQIPQLNCKKTRTVNVVDEVKPTITLKGSPEVFTFVGSEYLDEGATAIDNYDGDLTNQIKVTSNLAMDKTGTYQISYQVKDKSGNETKVSRKVVVGKDPMNIKLKYNYDLYDNEAMQWWFKKSEDHKRNEGAWDNEKINKYDSYYIGEDEKVLYLTFDEGGSEKTYIKEIADILDKYNVKGTFFLTRNYIVKEADFIRELVANGHLIGNHTRNHLNMSSLANANDIGKFVEEVTSVEKAYMQVTGKEMVKTFRFPKGEASERTLKMVQDLGYKNFFWSHAYYDFGPELNFDEAYKAMIDYYHNGAIYLMHPNNKGNYVALEAFVKEMLDQGYTFKTVDAIEKR